MCCLSVTRLLTLIASTIFVVQNCVDCNKPINTGSSDKFWHFQRTFYDSSGGSDKNLPASVSSGSASSLSSYSPYSPRTLAQVEKRQNLHAISLANEHLMKVRNYHRCGVPRAKIVRVKDVHNVPSKEYLPRCTVLYQCDDESGCCEDSTMGCVPTETQEVQLYFYAIQIEREHDDAEEHHSEGVRGQPFTEMLSFTNHTKCGCEEINYRPRTINSNQGIRLNTIGDHALTDEEDEVEDELSSSGSHHSQQCKWVDCPEPFFARLQSTDQKCICDCFDRDRDCLRIKRGKDSLSPTEKRCVQSGRCLEPLCDQGGSFNRHEGICVIHKHLHHKYRNVHSQTLTSNHHVRHHNNHHQRKHHHLHERD